MLEKRTQRKLALYFIAMTALQGFLLWQARRDIADGLPDFTSFYTAAKIVRNGFGYQLYNLDLQQEVQNSIVPVSVLKRHALLPYDHPPFEVVVFLPLAGFSYRAAYWIWFALNLGLLAATIAVLRMTLPVIGKLPVYLSAFAGLSFAPIFITLLQGQDSILFLFCFCMFVASFRRNSQVWAGVWLGVALFKFHIVLLFLLPFVFMRSVFLKGFFAAAALLALISLKVTGLRESLFYPRYLWQLNKDVRLRALVGSDATASLYGFVSSVIGVNHTQFASALIVFLSAVLLAIAILISRRARNATPHYCDLVIAANILIVSLLSYHVWAHDLSLILLPIALMMEVTASEAVILGWAKRMFWICTTILFCSPITIFLLKYHKLYALVIVISAMLFIALRGIFTWEEMGAGTTTVRT